MTDYFNQQSKFNSDAEEIQMYLDVIYHDRKKGNNVILYKKAEEDPTSESCVYSASRIERCEDTDVYASVGTFSGKRRIGADLFNRAVMVVDLDCHTPSYRVVKENTAKRLNQAFQDNTLPVPTMIVDTGRGYHCYYVYEKSVPNCARLVRMNRRFDYVYDKLIGAYDNVLTGSGESVFCDVDKCVTDATRVMRVPGTWNTKTKEKARLLFVNSAYGKVSYIDKFIDVSKYDPFTEEDIEEKKKPIYTGNKAVYGDVAEKMMLTNRYNNLCTLMENRKNIPEHQRELICFLAYNTMKQIGDEEFARAKMECINNISYYPLSDRELNNIEKNLANRETAYHFTNQRISEILKLNNEEIELFNNANKRSVKRAVEKLHNAIDREIKKTEAAAFIDVNTDYTYDYIAEIFECSKRWISSVAEEYGVRRKNRDDRGDIQGVYKKKLQKFVTVFCSDINKAYVNNTLSEHDLFTVLPENVLSVIEDAFKDVSTFLKDCLKAAGAYKEPLKAVDVNNNTVNDVAFKDITVVDITTERETKVTNDDTVNTYVNSFITYLCDNCKGRFQGAAKVFDKWYDSLEDTEYKAKLTNALYTMGRAYETMPVIDFAVNDLNRLYADSKEKKAYPVVGGKKVKKAVVTDVTVFEWHPELSKEAKKIEAYIPALTAESKHRPAKFAHDNSRRLMLEEIINECHYDYTWDKMIRLKDHINESQQFQYEHVMNQLKNVGKQKLIDYVLGFMEHYDPYIVNGDVRAWNQLFDLLRDHTLKFFKQDNIYDIHIKKKEYVMTEKRFKANQVYKENQRKNEFLNAMHDSYVVNEVCKIYKYLRRLTYNYEEIAFCDRTDLVSAKTVKSVLWNATLEDIKAYVDLADADMDKLRVEVLFDFLSDREKTREDFA